MSVDLRVTLPFPAICCCSLCSMFVFSLSCSSIQVAVRLTMVPPIQIELDGWLCGIALSLVAAARRHSKVLFIQSFLSQIE